jgi:hypothetical protein
MFRLVLALAVCACGGPAVPRPKGPPPIPKRVALSWGQVQKGESTDVFVQLTDETGKQVSYPVGTYPGVCTVKEPSADMNAQIGMACLGPGGKDTELHGVVQRDEVIILKLVLDGGVKPDPMAREEVTRIKAPGGAAIQIGT